MIGQFSFSGKKEAAFGIWIFSWRLSFFSFFCLLFLMVSLPVRSAGWAAVAIPASLNSDKTLRLLLNETQGLTLVLQADATITGASSTQTGTLTWNFPRGMRALSNGGYYGVTDASEWDSGNRHFQSFSFSFANAQLDGTPGSRVSSEWKNQIFFVQPTETPLSGNDFVSLTLTQGANQNVWTWPLAVSSLQAVTTMPEKITLGFWDYNYGRAGIASGGVARLFRDVGIRYVQAASDATYRQALNSEGIVSGGNTHHSYFRLVGFPNYDVDGVADTGSFPCPQDIIALPSGSAIPGVSTLISKAESENGFASFDYEPTGIDGFCASAIARFKSENGVSDAEFNAFRAYFSANRLNTFKTTDAGILDTYTKWTNFSTRQSAEYISRIRQGVNAESSTTRLMLTTSRGYAGFLSSYLSLGNDASAMAPFVDYILPQLYFSGENLGVKQVIKFVRGWKQEIDDSRPQTELWPLLLVRYTGATSGNSPARLFQQIIAATASGARGILLYYPSNLDAGYWSAIGDAARNLALYEDYYEGASSEQSFSLSGMPSTNGTQLIYPGYDSPLTFVDWHFTAHKLGSSYLLTLFNLQSGSSLDFPVSTALNVSIGSVQGATQIAPMTWRVPANGVAFVVLNTTPTVTSCSTISPATWGSVPGGNAGYGAPYDVFTSNVSLLKADCRTEDIHTIQATLGVLGDTTRIVYTKGYYYANGNWTQYTGICTGALNGDWCQGSVSATITDPNLSTASAAAPAYFVGMTCSVQGGSWRCGCRDTNCANFYWQIQGAGQ